MEDDDFRSVIEEATRTYSERICAAVRQHIANKRAETESTASARNEADLDPAKEIASRQLSRRLGRRLDDTKREQLLNRAADAVGSGRRKPMIDADGFQLVVKPKNKLQTSPGNVTTPSKKRRFEPSPPPVSTSNRYDTLDTRTDMEPDDEEESAAIVIDDNENVVASFLANAKTCAQVEKETASAVATSCQEQVAVEAEVHSVPCPPRTRETAPVQKTWASPEHRIHVALLIAYVT